MRHIDDNIWRDEWFAELDPLGALLWVGILTAGTDDQGRFLDNAELVKSDVFPMKKIDADVLGACLTAFVDAGKLIRYEAGGKKLLQVRNWWKYQNKSQWMNPSKYPAPEGWADAWRKNGPGRKPECSANWGTKGGYSAEPSTPPSGAPHGQPHGAPSTPPSPEYDKEKEKDYEKEKDKEKQGAKNAAPEGKNSAAAAANQYFTNAGEGQAHKILLEASQLAAVPQSELSRLDGVAALIATYGREKCLEALVEARKEWVRTPKKTGGGGTYSVLNFAWVDWASEYLATGVKRWEENRKGKDHANHPRRSEAPEITDRARDRAGRILALQGEPSPAAK